MSNEDSEVVWSVRVSKEDAKRFDKLVERLPLASRATVAREVVRKGIEAVWVEHLRKAGK